MQKCPNGRYHTIGPDRFPVRWSLGEHKRQHEILECRHVKDHCWFPTLDVVRWRNWHKRRKPAEASENTSKPVSPFTGAINGRKLQNFELAEEFFPAPWLADEYQVGSSLEGNDQRHLNADREHVARRHQTSGRPFPHQPMISACVTHCNGEIFNTCLNSERGTCGTNLQTSVFPESASRPRDWCNGLMTCATTITMWLPSDRPTRAARKEWKATDQEFSWMSSWHMKSDTVHKGDETSTHSKQLLLLW